MTARIDAEYVLPIRRAAADVDPEFAGYLRELAVWIDVTLVDGSTAPVAAALRKAIDGTAIRHLVPLVAGTNGKACGAMTGLLVARHERVVIADDDVRYTHAQLARACALLAAADFVRPQNVYAPAPWWARWDTGRMLLNRAFGGDFGGTAALRRSSVLRGGGYRTDVLFENLELERTVRAHGGRIRVARGLVVVRRPPTLRHFAGQRVRQAYDDFAQPRRLAVELALLPVLLLAAALRSRATTTTLVLAIVGTAEIGRRVENGDRVFSPDGALWSPVWILERAVTVWLALGARVCGGVRYSGGRLRDAASPPARLSAARQGATRG